MKSRFTSSIFGRVSHLAVGGSILVLVAALSNCGKSQPPPPPLAIGPSSLPNLSTSDPVQLPLDVTGGVSPYNWSVSAGTLPHGLSLSFPSPSTAVAVITGTPDTAAESVNFTIHVNDSSGGSGSQPYTVSVLLGGDSMTISPSPLNFGPQLLTTLSAPQTTTVTNVVLSPIAISTVAIGGDSSEFGVNQTCSNTTLAVGASCTLSAIFNPAQAGPRSATITITDDTQGSPHSLSLNGTGTVSGANATLSATSISFGSVAVGDTSESQSVTLINYGSAALNISGITASADFVETDNCTAVAPLTRCSINVTFSPTSTGTVNGTLSVTDNGAGSPQTVGLIGSGVAGKCQSKGMGCSVVFRCCPGLQCEVTGPTGGAVCQ
ncbi:MAG: choice-of-anchor D domain-containing protein [Terriglobales bacterium]